MDISELKRDFQAIAALRELSILAKAAQQDGTISPDEMAKILADGVAPILELYGVSLDLPLHGTGEVQSAVRTALDFASRLL